MPTQTVWFLAFKILNILKFGSAKYCFSKYNLLVWFVVLNLNTPISDAIQINEVLSFVSMEILPTAGSWFGKSFIDLKFLV